MFAIIPDKNKSFEGSSTNHPGRDGKVRGGINEDEGPGAAVVLVAVGEEGRGRLDSNAGHVVDADGDVVFHAVEGVDVDAVQDLGDLGLDVARGVSQDVARRRVERRFAEPADAGIEGLGALGLVVGTHEHVAAAEVDVVRQGHGDAQGRERLVEGSVADKDLVDGAFLSAGQCHNLVAGLPNARCDAPCVTAKVAVGVGLGGESRIGRGNGNPAGCGLRPRGPFRGGEGGCLRRTTGCCPSGRPRCRRGAH